MHLYTIDLQDGADITPKWVIISIWFFLYPTCRSGCAQRSAVGHTEVGWDRLGWKEVGDDPTNNPHSPTQHHSAAMGADWKEDSLPQPQSSLPFPICFICSVEGGFGEWEQMKTLTLFSSWYVKKGRPRLAHVNFLRMSWATLPLPAFCHSYSTFTAGKGHDELVWGASWQPSRGGILSSWNLD